MSSDLLLTQDAMRVHGAYCNVLDAFRHAVPGTDRSWDAYRVFQRVGGTAVMWASMVASDREIRDGYYEARADAWLHGDEVSERPVFEVVVPVAEPAGCVRWVTNPYPFEGPSFDERLTRGDFDRDPEHPEQGKYGRSCCSWVDGFGCPWYGTRAPRSDGRSSRPHCYGWDWDEEGMRATHRAMDDPGVFCLDPEGFLHAAWECSSRCTLFPPPENPGPEDLEVVG